MRTSSKDGLFPSLELIVPLWTALNTTTTLFARNAQLTLKPTFVFLDSSGLFFLPSGFRSLLFWFNSLLRARFSSSILISAVFISLRYTCFVHYNIVSFRTLDLPKIRSSKLAILTGSSDPATIPSFLLEKSTKVVPTEKLSPPARDPMPVTLLLVDAFSRLLWPSWRTLPTFPRSWWKQKLIKTVFSGGAYTTAAAFGNSKIYDYLKSFGITYQVEQVHKLWLHNLVCEL